MMRVETVLMRSAIAGLVIAMLGAGWLMATRDAAVESADGQAAYVCPMHPDETSATAGKCSRCGMALVLASPYDTRDYQLTVETEPEVVTAGEPFTVRLAVFRPGTGQAVKDFEVVHEKRYHLFIVSRDMEVFEHVHPEQMPDGRWAMRATLPKPGLYLIVSDFLPTRGSSQLIARPLVTAGYAPDIDPPPMQSDEDGTARTVDGITATISYQPTRFWAEVSSNVTFTLKESVTQQPITDLQPYLGSLGHTFMMSEDMLDYVHAHPALSADVGSTSVSGGPNLTFDVFMPRPGRYKAWTQFRRHDKIYTFPFTFTVLDPVGAPPLVLQAAGGRTR